MNNKITFRDILKNRSKSTMIISVLITVFFAVVIATYNVLLLKSVSENMVSTGQISAERLRP